jgi:NTP pyrophosphatase (non-canonical NTP hydrolase)
MTIENTHNNNLKEILQAVKTERAYQDRKWGPLHDRQQSIAGFLLVMEGELAEAKKAWLKNTPSGARHSVLEEILQVAAVAVACLQQHGLSGTGNPDYPL